MEEKFNNANLKITPLPYTITQLIEEYEDWNENAPYQRDYAWDDAKSEKLIVSIFNGIPIGDFHIVLDENRKFYWILDGKQRRHAIWKFFENEVNIPIMWDSDGHPYVPVIVDSNKKVTKMTKKVMEKHDDEQVRMLIKNFKKTLLHVISWSPMKTAEQRKLFDQMNYSAPLNINERIYCPNYMSKKLFKFIFDEFIKNTKTLFIRKELRDNKRFSGIRYIHNMCCMCFGLDMKDTFSYRNLSKDLLNQSAKKIHDHIIDDLNISDNYEFNEELMEKLELLNNLKLIKKCGKFIGELHKPIEKNIYDGNFIFDIMCFLIIKIQKKEITFSQLEKNGDKFRNFIDQYNEFKNLKKESKYHSTNVKKLEQRFNKMEEILNSLDIDLGIKNQKVPQYEKIKTLLNSDGKCESCGIDLNQNPNSCRMDHVDAKCLASKTNYGILCEQCNLTKSNKTKEELIKNIEIEKNLVNYMSSKEIQNV